MVAKLTAERLRELFHYDPDTGIFTNRTNRGRARVGAIAGCPNGDGYINIWIYEACYHAHRLAWLYVHGEWPATMLDHINRNPSDNRISNLRLATHAQNNANKVARTKYGLKGVNRTGKNCWQAQIKHMGHRYVLSGFKTAEEAHQAYMAKARELHGDFARG